MPIKTPTMQMLVTIDETVPATIEQLKQLIERIENAIDALRMLQDKGKEMITRDDEA